MPWPEGFFDTLGDGELGAELGLLREVHEPKVAAAGDCSVVGVVETGEDATESALARAVDAYETDALTEVDGERDVTQYGRCSEGF